MTTSSMNSLPNLIVFPEDCQLVGLSNWAIFRGHLKSVAQATGLIEYLDSTIPSPTPPAAGIPTAVPRPTPINLHSPSIEEWELRDAQIAGIIYQNIKDHRSLGISQDLSAQAMWTALTTEFDTTSAAAQTLVKEHIQQFKYPPSTPFEEYFQQLEALCKAASDIGCTITSEDLCSQFLTLLTLEYLWIIQTHGARAYLELKCILIKYNMMVKSVTTLLVIDSSLNTLITGSRSTSGIICDNSPKGMEPTKAASPAPVITSSSIDSTPSSTTIAAAIYDFAKSSGRMATEGQAGAFAIEGYGIAEITVKTQQGSVHHLHFPASHTPSFAMNLLSMPSMDWKGYWGVWGNGCIEVQHLVSNAVVVDGHLASGNVFLVMTLPMFWLPLVAPG
ncbi:hypothetical protein GYMLUDRAFT_248455 [Collybiopsis luxurians FD-317 M1]|uniref:Uncharacterized protein n=1 Tax=Collybiopsis luxurians FD-317 M1 TaxID=944289 RepID=A0A0D0AYB1_9AGAR|nr:hypothetical protein GYMLUDRAFT_248455 [Collybiopsis luxurians FD-317 M1]